MRRAGLRHADYRLGSGWPSAWASAFSWIWSVGT